MITNIVFLLMGAIIGWLASKIVGANNRMGVVANIIVGIIGTFIGSYIGQKLGYANLGVLSLSGFIFSVIGAVLFLLLVLFIAGKR